MDINSFASFLKDLESYFNFPLEPNSNNTCLIQLRTGLQIQFEPDRYGNLLIAIKLGVIPSSRYRELVFKEALKANAADSPTALGAFGASRSSGQLILFAIIDDRSANAENIKEMLPAFLEKAQRWDEAIKRGDVPIGVTHPANRPNVFGMIR